MSQGARRCPSPCLLYRVFTCILVLAGAGPRLVLRAHTQTQRGWQGIL